MIYCMEFTPRKAVRHAAMSPGDRRQFILDRLEELGAGSYDEFAELLRVSAITIRRDLELLVQQGAVIKTVGGVQRANAPSCLYETAVYARLSVNRAEKRAIALRALDLIQAQSTIYLDSSTTCLELARNLATKKKGLTIITNSAMACLELGRNGDNTIIGIGGQYDVSSLCYVGSQAEDWAKELFVDIAFVGTKALLPSKGTFESSMPTFRMKQIVAQRCTQLVLLVDHSKFGQRALSKVLDIGQIHTVVTDEKASQADLAALAKAGPKVCLAAMQAARPGRKANVA
jgi:DeoR family transcriptional regulator of aga operon